MKFALAVSLALHVALLWGADAASRSLRERRIPVDFIAVSLVGGAPAAPKPARPASVEPVPAKPAPQKPAPRKPEARSEPPRKQVPDIAEKPRKKPEQKKAEAQRTEGEPKSAPPAKEEPREAAPSPAESPVAGPGLGDVRLDTSDFPFAYYLTALRNKLSQHWTPAPLPPGTAARAVTVYFRVQADGRVTDAAVKSPSGNGFFDRAALRAVLNASPLSPLPREFPGPSLGVHLEFKQTAP